MAFQAGSCVGPYELLGLLGSGGMGEVFRARDTRLGRIVAIKHLKVEHGARFAQEARAIAALNHPHICQIYDVGPDYLVLEYVDGVPLRGPVAVDKALGFAIQCADAVEAAHRRGILHRDLKPANILVTADGTVKLLDFGLARLIEPDEDVTRTAPGVVLGTTAYMSPEQAQGRPPDVRSDIFSFGAVLYELLSGRRAFPGDTTAGVLSAVLRDDPVPPPGPRALVEIVRRCLQKPPEIRFQTMAELRSALERVARDLAVEGLSASQGSIAVLAFANMSADPENEYFSDGLAEDIINALTHVPGLKVIARTSAFAFKGQHGDIRRIADTLGVAHVLEGSVRKAGNRIRVTAQLINAADGSHLWAARYDRELSDVFAIQDEIATAIATALSSKLADKALRRHTPTLPAYEALLRGRHELLKFTPDSSERARARFEEAASLDPDFAEPHAQLGLCYLLMATNGVRAFRDVVSFLRAEAQRALTLDASEPSPRYLLGSAAAVFDYDWRAAADHFRAALASTSDAPHLHWAYASFYFQPLGRFEDGIAEMRREVERDPLNVPWRSVFCYHLMNAERYDEAIEEVRRALDIDETHWLPHFMLAQIYAYTGRFTAAVTEAEIAHRAVPFNSMPTGVLAGALAQLGDTRRAQALITEMGDSPLPTWGRVEYHLLCSEIDDAARWYERMIDARDPFAIVFAAAPVGRGLRRSAHWARLAKMMNLPMAPGR